jgi:hypothetical protein
MSYFTYNINSIDAYIINTHVNVFLFSFFIVGLVGRCGEEYCRKEENIHRGIPLDEKKFLRYVCIINILGVFSHIFHANIC